ncbi:MAG: PrsW family intramembrane metalloprotease [Candidatus Coatesbacteria bacterium]|nr:PrsW family intramembrane metalloprotease [Candidatus Coatesbacteria bacterium]
MKFILKIISGQDEGKSFSLEDGNYTIGRNPSNSIPIQDARISGQHCNLEIKGNKVILNDLKSTNGTFLGGVQVKIPTLIELPSSFQIGDTYLEIIKDPSSLTEEEARKAVSEKTNQASEAPDDILNKSFFGIADLKDDPGSKTFIHIGKSKIPWKKALFWILSLSLISIGGCIKAYFYLTALTNPNVTGPLVIATFVAFLPFIPYAFIIRMLDFNNRIKWHLFIVTLLWGGIFAIGFAGLVNSTVIDITGSRQFVTVLFAPWFEETLKGLAIAVIFILLYDEFDSTIDGLIFGMAVGLGFAIMENINYFAQAFMGQFGDPTLVLIIRSTLLPTICHPSWTAFTGFGFGLARESKKGCLRYIWPVIGYTGAVTTHMMWNGGQTLISTGDSMSDLLLKIIIIGSFVVFVMSSAYLWAFFRERRVINKYLKDVADPNIVAPEEYRYLVGWFGNTRWKLHSLSTYGISGLWSGSKLHKLQVRLAFRRWHLDQGDRFKGTTMDRIERDLIKEIKETRKKLSN